MAKRTRIKHTKEITSKIWNRYQKGESLKAIARLLDTQSSSIFAQLVPTGGKGNAQSYPSRWLNEKRYLGRL